MVLAGVGYLFNLIANNIRTKSYYKRLERSLYFHLSYILIKLITIKTKIIFNFPLKKID